VFNPLNEVIYRYKLAKNFLREAEEAFKRGDWRNTVSASQLAAENAAKAIIAFYRIPSWSHDPSHELLSILSNIPSHVRKLTEEVAVIARTLAPEHGRSTYGEPTRGLTPWDIYKREDAEKAINIARKAVKNTIKVLKALNIKLPPNTNNQIK